MSRSCELGRKSSCGPATPLMPWPGVWTRGSRAAPGRRGSPVERVFPACGPSAGQAAPLRESAGKPGGGQQRCSFQPAEAPRLVAPRGVQPSSAQPELWVTSRLGASERRPAPTEVALRHPRNRSPPLPHLPPFFGAVQCRILSTAVFYSAV